MEVRASDAHSKSISIDCVPAAQAALAAWLGSTRVSLDGSSVPVGGCWVRRLCCTGGGGRGGGRRGGGCSAGGCRVVVLRRCSCCRLPAFFSLILCLPLLLSPALAPALGRPILVSLKAIHCTFRTSPFFRSTVLSLGALSFSFSLFRFSLSLFLSLSFILSLRTLFLARSTGCSLVEVHAPEATIWSATSKGSSGSTRLTTSARSLCCRHSMLSATTTTTAAATTAAAALLCDLPISFWITATSAVPTVHNHHHHHPYHTVVSSIQLVAI